MSALFHEIPSLPVFISSSSKYSRNRFFPTISLQVQTVRKTPMEFNIDMEFFTLLRY